MAWREYGQPNASGGVDIYRTDDQGNFEYVRSETMEQNQGGGASAGGDGGYDGGGGGYGGGGGNVGYIPGYDYYMGMGGQAIAQANAKYQQQLIELQKARMEAIDKPNAETQRRALEAEMALGQSRQQLAEAQRQDQVNQFAQQQGAQQQQFDVNTAMNTWQAQNQQSAQRGAATGGYAATSAQPDLPYHYQRDQLVRDWRAQFGENPTSAQVEQQLPWSSNATQQSPTTQMPTTPSPDDKAKADSIRRQIEAKVGRAITEPEWNTLVSGKFDPQHPMVTGGQAQAGSLLADLTNKPGDQHPMKIPGIELIEQMPESYKQLREGQPAYSFYDPQQGMINSRTGQIQVPDGQGGTKDLGPAKGYTPTEKKQDLQLFGDGNQTGGGQVGIQGTLPGPSTDFSKFDRQYATASEGNQPGVVSAQGQEAWREGLTEGTKLPGTPAQTQQMGNIRARMEAKQAEKQAAIMRGASQQELRQIDAKYGPLQTSDGVSAQGMPTSLPGQGSTDFSKFQSPYATDVNSNVGKSQQPYTPVGQPASTTGGTIGPASGGQAQGQAQGQTPGQQQGGQESLQMVYNPITGQMEYKGINLMQQQLAEELGRGNLTIAQANQKLDEEVQRGNLTIAQKDQALRELQNQQQYGLQGRAQTLSEQLGLGGLSLDQAAQKLNEEVQRGNLSIAQKNQALQELQNQQQYGLQGRAQTLSEQLGLGGLSLDQAAQKLDEEVQRGSLTIAQKDQLLREKQSGQQFGLQEAGVTGQYGGQATLEREQFKSQEALDKARQTLDEKVQLGQLSVVERDQALKELQTQQDYNIAQRAQALSEQTGLGELGLSQQKFGWGKETDVANLLGEYGGKSTLEGRAQSLQEKQAEQDWQYKQAMMAANPANYAVTAAMQGRAPWQQGLLGETGQQPAAQAASSGPGFQSSNMAAQAQQGYKQQIGAAAQGQPGGWQQQPGGGQRTVSGLQQDAQGMQQQITQLPEYQALQQMSQQMQAEQQRLVQSGATPEQIQAFQQQAQQRMAPLQQRFEQASAPLQQQVSTLGQQIGQRSQAGGGAGSTGASPGISSADMLTRAQQGYQQQVGGGGAYQAQAQAVAQGMQAQSAQQQPAWKQGLLSGQSAGAATADLKAKWGVPQAQKMSGLQYGRMGADQKAAFGSAVQATGQSQQDYEGEMKKWQPKAQGTAATQWR